VGSVHLALSLPAGLRHPPPTDALLLDPHVVNIRGRVGATRTRLAGPADGLFCALLLPPAIWIALYPPATVFPSLFWVLCSAATTSLPNILAATFRGSPKRRSLCGIFAGITTESAASRCPADIVSKWLPAPVTGHNQGRLLGLICTGVTAKSSLPMCHFVCVTQKWLAAKLAICSDRGLSLLCHHLLSRASGPVLGGRLPARVRGEDRAAQGPQKEHPPTRRTLAGV
jgi:hypothetical protein